MFGLAHINNGDFLNYVMRQVMLTKGPFIAIQLNSTRRRVELSCVAINGP